MFSSAMSRGFIAFCLTTAIIFISIPAFCQDISNYVNCTNRKNDDKLLFLQQNYLSTTMYHCKEGFLKQKGCYIHGAARDKKCVTLTAFKADVSLLNPLDGLYDDRTDQILCDKYVNDGFIQKNVHPNIAEKCPGDGQTKYNLFGGHPLCNTKDVQVYEFGERAWKKCDEDGQFIVQNCITSTPKRCITKTYWVERVENSPDRENIRNHKLPFCEKMENYFEEAEHSDDFTECNFDGPIVVNRPVPSTEAAAMSTSVSISLKPEATTIEIETTTNEDELPPGEKCLHGALNDVWYENDVPLKCQIRSVDKKTCVDYVKLYNNLTYYDNKGNPRIWQQNWRRSKANMLRKYDDINKDFNYGLNDSIRQLYRAQHWNYSSALENIEIAFTPEDKLQLNDDLINKPYFFCHLVQHFLPIGHRFLLEQSESCPSSEYVKDNCIKADHTRVPMGYPKIMHNVYYNKEKKPVKCYVKEAKSQCINFDNAQRLLSNLETIIRGPGYNDKKDDLLKARLKYNAELRDMFTWNVLSLKQRMNAGDDIVEIIEKHFKQLVDFEGEIERDFTVNGEKIKMGPPTFCIIIGELIPVNFDHEKVTGYFERCDFDGPVDVTMPVASTEATTSMPIVSTSTSTKPETTTTEIETTTQEEEKCLHGALNDVWYENNVPIKCQVLWVDEKTCIDYQKLYKNLTYYRKNNPNIWYNNWDENKANMLRKYNDINKDYKYDLYQSINELFWGPASKFEYAVKNIETSFTPNSALNDEFINKPFVFCQLVHNFLPIKHDFLLEHSEDCPSSSYVEHYCIKTNDRNIMGYPKIIHNVYYNEEKEPAKCYVKEANSSCINFDNAQHLLTDLETIIRSPQQGYSYKKEDLLKARIKLDVERRYTDSSYISSLQQRMNDGDDIVEIIEYNFKMLVNFEGEVEREFVVDGYGIKMGPATFCAIIGELIPVDFRHKNLTKYLEKC